MWVVPWKLRSSGRTLSAGEVLFPEARLEQEAGDRFEEYSAHRPDEMHVHLLRDDDVSVDQQLAVQRTRRHAPTRNLQPAVNTGQPAQVELLFDAGRDMVSRGGQIIGLGAVRRGQERQELVVVVSRRVGAVVVLALEKSDGEARRLLAEHKLKRGQCDGEHKRQYSTLPSSYSASVSRIVSHLQNRAVRNRYWRN